MSNDKSGNQKKITKGAAAQIEGDQKKVTKKDLLNQMGSSGTSLLNGYINEEYNSALAGVAGMKKYEIMRKSDAQISASLLVCELPIRATDWFIDPCRDQDDETVSEESKEIAAFISDALFKKMEITWDDLLREILTMLAFGHSVFEKVYTSDGEHVFLKKLGSRKQTTIQKRETESGAAGITQYLLNDMDGKNMVSIPAQKLLIFSFRKEGDNYEGTSALRPAYKHWFMKDKFYRFDAVRQERQSVGIPVIYLPEGASDEDKAEAKTIVENVRSTEQTGIVIPGPKDNGWLFEFADTRADKSTNIFESIKHHNREISKNVLAQFLELGATESGSRSLSEDQSDLFLLGLQSIASYICDIFNRYLIPELVDLNFDTDCYPHLKFNKLGSINYVDLATALEKLANSNIVQPDDDLESHVRDLMDLPSKRQLKDGEEQRKPLKTTPEAPKPNSDDDKVDGDDMKKEGKETKVKASEGCGHDHDLTNTFFDNEYWNISQFINNEAIIKLQNECRSNEDQVHAKKKGFKFNEFEKVAPRPLTFAERKVNFASLKRSLDTFESVIAEKLDTVGKKMKADLIAQVKKAVESNDIKAIGSIKVKYVGEMSQALTDVQKEMFEIGKKTAAVEIGVKVPPTKKEVRGALRVQNDNVVKQISNGMETTTKSAVLQQVNSNNGSVTNTTTAAAIAAASANIDKLLITAKATLNTMGTVGAVTMGRGSIFERYPEKIYGFQYSAILDGRTTDYCRSLDGRVVKPGSAEYIKYAPQKHYNCRSLRVAILVEETFKPKFTGVPSKIKTPASMETFKKMSGPVLLKNSPALVQVKTELDERKKKLADLKKLGQYPNRQKQHEKRINQLESALAKPFNEGFHQYLMCVLASE